MTRTSLLVEVRRGKEPVPVSEGSGLPSDLEIHVLDQVLEVGLVLVRSEREWLAIGNMQIHSVLQ